MGKSKGFVSCCVVSFLIVVQLGRSAHAQSTAGGVLWEEVQKLIYELVKRQAVKDLGGNIRNRSPEICYYFGDAISRMGSRNWGGVQGALKDGAITAMGDFIYWRMTTGKKYLSFSDNVRGFRKTFDVLRPDDAQIAIATTRLSSATANTKITTTQFVEATRRLENATEEIHKATVDASTTEQERTRAKQNLEIAKQDLEIAKESLHVQEAKFKNALKNFKNAKPTYGTASGSPHPLCSRRWWASLDDVNIGQIEQHCEKAEDTKETMACGVANAAMAYLRDPEQSLPVRKTLIKAIVSFVWPILKKPLGDEFSVSLVENLISDPSSFTIFAAKLPDVLKRELKGTQCGEFDERSPLICLALEHYGDAKSIFTSLDSGVVRLEIDQTQFDVDWKDLVAGKQTVKSRYITARYAQIWSRYTEFNKKLDTSSKYTDSGKETARGEAYGVAKAATSLSALAKSWKSQFKEAGLICSGKQSSIEITIVSPGLQKNIVISLDGSACQSSGILPLVAYIRDSWSGVAALRTEIEGLQSGLRKLGISVLSLNSKSLLAAQYTVELAGKLAEKIESRLETLPERANDFGYLFAVVDTCLAFALNDAGPTLTKNLVEKLLQEVEHSGKVGNSNRQSLEAILGVLSLLGKTSILPDNLKTLATGLEELRILLKEEEIEAKAKAKELLTILQSSDKAILLNLPSIEILGQEANNKYFGYVGHILGIESEALQTIARYANDPTLRSLMRFVRQGDVREIALLLLESSLLSSGSNGSRNRLVVNFARYVLDKADKESSKDIARDAFRAAALEWLEESSDDWQGFPLVLNSKGEKDQFRTVKAVGTGNSLWWFFRPTLGVRYLRNRLSPGDPSYEPSATISTARVFQLALSDRIGLQGTLLDLDVAGRGLANHHHVERKTDKPFLAVDIFRPRLDLWFGIPSFSRRLVVLAGVSHSFVDVDDSDTTGKLQLDWGIGNFDFDFGLGYFF